MASNSLMSNQGQACGESLLPPFISWPGSSDLLLLLPLSQVVVSFSIGGVSEVFLGSVAGYLTRHCPRPFAVLHLGAKGAQGTAGTAAAPAGRNLLVPVDGSEESFQSCRWTLDNLYRTGKDKGAAATTKSCSIAQSQQDGCRAWGTIILPQVACSSSSPSLLAGDTIHLCHVIPRLPNGNLMNMPWILPEEVGAAPMDEGFLFVSPSYTGLLGVTAPEIMFAREKKALKLEQVISPSALLVGPLCRHGSLLHLFSTTGSSPRSG